MAQVISDVHVNAITDLMSICSAGLNGVSKHDIAPLRAVLNLIKYDPSKGRDHIEQTISHIKVALSECPDLAEFLIFLLPPTPSLSNGVKDCSGVLKSSEMQSLNNINSTPDKEASLETSKTSSNNVTCNSQCYDEPINLVVREQIAGADREKQSVGCADSINKDQYFADFSHSCGNSYHTGLTLSAFKEYRQLKDNHRHGRQFSGLLKPSTKKKNKRLRSSYMSNSEVKRATWHLVSDSSIKFDNNQSRKVGIQTPAIQKFHFNLAQNKRFLQGKKPEHLLPRPDNSKTKMANQCSDAANKTVDLRVVTNSNLTSTSLSDSIFINTVMSPIHQERMTYSNFADTPSYQIDQSSTFTTSNIFSKAREMSPFNMDGLNRERLVENASIDSRPVSPWQIFLNNNSQQTSPKQTKNKIDNKHNFIFIPEQIPVNSLVQNNATSNNFVTKHNMSTNKNLDLMYYNKKLLNCSYSGSDCNNFYACENVNKSLVDVNTHADKSLTFPNSSLNLPLLPLINFGSSPWFINQVSEAFMSTSNRSTASKVIGVNSWPKISSFNPNQLKSVNKHSVLQKHTKIKSTVHHFPNHIVKNTYSAISSSNKVNKSSRNMPRTPMNVNSCGYEFNSNKTKPLSENHIFVNGKGQSQNAPNYHMNFPLIPVPVRIQARYPILNQIPNYVNGAVSCYSFVAAPAHGLSNNIQANDRDKLTLGNNCPAPKRLRHIEPVKDIQTFDINQPADVSPHLQLLQNLVNKTTNQNSGFSSVNPSEPMTQYLSSLANTDNDDVAAVNRLDPPVTKKDSLRKKSKRKCSRPQKNGTTAPFIKLSDAPSPELSHSLDKLMNIPLDPGIQKFLHLPAEEDSNKSCDKWHKF